MPFKLFSDLDKSCNDLFKKSFTWGQKVTVDTKATNGAAFSNEFTRDAEGKTASSCNMKFKHPSGFNVDKLQISSKHQLDANISLTDTALANAKFKLGVKLVDLLSDMDDEESFIGVDYTHDLFTLSAAADPVSSKAKASISSGYQSMLFGCDANFDASAANKIVNSSYAAGYAGGDFTLLAKAAKGTFAKKGGGTEEKNTVTVTLHQSNGAMQYGAKMGYNVAEKDKAKKLAMSFISKYTMDEDTSFVASLEKGSAISMAYKQQLRPQCAMTASLGFDLSALTGKGTSSKFGLGFNFSG